MWFKRKATNNQQESSDRRSARYWTQRKMPALLRIISVECSIQSMFTDLSIPKEFESLLLPQWKTLHYESYDLINVDDFDCPEDVKALLCNLQQTVHESHHFLCGYRDGYMKTLLNILKFDDHHCVLHRQYKPFTKRITNVDLMSISSTLAQPKIEILSRNQKSFIIIDGMAMAQWKTRYEYEGRKFDNTKEDQVLRELFIAVHDIAQNCSDISFPINVYAVRVRKSFFTFYKAIAEEEYVTESSMRFPTKHSLLVQKHPPTTNSISRAYDFCFKDERKQILKCLISIKQWLREE
ncbi:hypothetical protein INT43_003046 [Umbelopsis isabellina]|uniref:Uncharacterized protein n=1 Tax=Mortierella isabellina TaxID=91625 RepID=A0A8H7PQQ8_MORIS|nr:hypothetical protein INT43_003046 [Umbelopsis isabellina]